MPQDQESVRQPARIAVVPPAADGQRLDNFLLGELALPRTRVYRLIRKGEVRVNKGRAQAMQKLRTGDEVRIPPYQPAEDAAPPGTPPVGLLEAFRSRVLLVAEGLKVLDKAAGWASQPGTGVRWSVVELARATWGEDWQPAHRLDRATSGCLAIVKGRPGMQDFAATAWTKRYLALVHGDASGAGGEWQDHLQRDAHGGVRAVTGAVAPPDAKAAQAQVQVLATSSQLSLLEVHLNTGRMHQIRVQAASRGWPLLGDAKYGDGRRDRALVPAHWGGLALHAQVLEGDWRGRPLCARAELPAEWQALLAAHGLADAIPRTAHS